MVQEGTVTFTAGDEVIEASGGQVVVAPPGLRTGLSTPATAAAAIGIHASDRFVTEWLEWQRWVDLDDLLALLGAAQ